MKNRKIISLIFIFLISLYGNNYATTQATPPIPAEVISIEDAEKIGFLIKKTYSDKDRLDYSFGKIVNSKWCKNAFISVYLANDKEIISSTSFYFYESVSLEKHSIENHYISNINLKKINKIAAIIGGCGNKLYQVNIFGK